MLGASVVVELYSESQARKLTSRAWAILRRAERSQRLAGQRASCSERRQAGPATVLASPRTDRSRR